MIIFSIVLLWLTKSEIAWLSTTSSISGLFCPWSKQPVSFVESLFLQTLFNCSKKIENCCIMIIIKLALKFSGFLVYLGYHILKAMRKIRYLPIVHVEFSHFFNHIASCENIWASTILNTKYTVSTWPILLDIACFFIVVFFFIEFFICHFKFSISNRGLLFCAIQPSPLENDINFESYFE